MFTNSARHYDRIYSWKDYRGESDSVAEIVRRHNPRARSLLDVACGTGRHLEFLRARYRVEGIDLDPQLLAIARERLPGVELHLADMREFDLGRTFDAITCLFSAIGYALTPDGLGSTVANLERHLAPGGVLIVEPWFSPEQYWWDHVHAVFVDDPELKIARINTAGTPGPVSILDFHYLIGTPEGVESFTERHELGLFTPEQYAGAFAGAGLEVHHDPEGLEGRGLYVGTKPR